MKFSTKNFKFRRYKGYSAFSSFMHYQEIKRIYSCLHLNVFHRFLDEVIIIPFYLMDKEFLKREFPEGHIIKVSRVRFEKRYIVLVFMNEVKKKCL